MGVPEVGLEYVHRMSELPGAGRDVIPELAFPEQLAAGAAVGREVRLVDQPRGGTDRGALGMLVEERAQQGGSGKAAARQAEVPDTGLLSLRGLVHCGQVLGSLSMDA